MPKVTMVLTERDAANAKRIYDLTNARSKAHALAIALSLTRYIADALVEGSHLLLKAPDGKTKEIVVSELNLETVGQRKDDKEGMLQRLAADLGVDR